MPIKTSVIQPTFNTFDLFNELKDEQVPIQEEVSKCLQRVQENLYNPDLADEQWLKSGLIVDYNASAQTFIPLSELYVISLQQALSAKKSIDFYIKTNSTLSPEEARSAALKKFPARLYPYHFQMIILDLAESTGMDAEQLKPRREALRKKLPQAKAATQAPPGMPDLSSMFGADGPLGNIMKTFQDPSVMQGLQQTMGDLSKDIQEGDDFASVAQKAIGALSGGDNPLGGILNSMGQAINAGRPDDQKLPLPPDGNINIGDILNQTIAGMKGHSAAGDSKAEASVDNVVPAAPATEFEPQTSNLIKFEDD